MVRDGEYELQVWVAKTAQELKDGGGIRLKEVPGPNPEPGMAFVQARPAGEAYCLKVINHNFKQTKANDLSSTRNNPGLGLSPCVAVKVDGKKTEPDLPPLHYGCLPNFGWRLDVHDKSAIKTFEFVDTPISEEGQTVGEVDPALGSFSAIIRATVWCEPYTARKSLTQHTSTTLCEGKAAKKHGATTSMPSLAETRHQEAVHTYHTKTTGVLAKLTIKYRSPVGLVAEGISPPDLWQDELEGTVVDTTSVDAAPNASQSQAKKRRRKRENNNKDEEAPPIVIEIGEDGPSGDGPSGDDSSGDGPSVDGASGSGVVKRERVKMKDIGDSGVIDLT